MKSNQAEWGVAKSWSMSDGRVPGCSRRCGPLDEEVMLISNLALFALEDDKLNFSI
jgi:hypothetical protein